MQGGASKGKDLKRMRTKGRPSWYVVVMISLITLIVTGCASPQNRLSQALDLEKQGRYEEAEAIWAPMAEKGDIEAQKRLAILYDSEEASGQKLRNPMREVYWLDMVVRNPQPINGSWKSIFLRTLGDRYRYGRGIAKDHRKACFYYQQSVDSGGLYVTRMLVEQCAKNGMSDQKDMPSPAYLSYPPAQLP